MYNLEQFRERMQSLGVPTAVEQPAGTASLHLSMDYDFMALLRITHASTQHLR